MKLLVLHAKGNTPESFRQRTSFLPIIIVGEEISCSYPCGPHDFDDNTFVWWKTPPGVRSFNATEYEGADESIALLEEYWGKNGPFDGILGFSQGAMLTGIICAKAAADPNYPIRPRFGILIGAAYPKPFAGDMEAGKKAANDGHAVATLHVLGATDDINPIEQGRAVLDCFGPKAEEWVHPGKHVIPSDDEALAVYRRFIAQFL